MRLLLLYLLLFNLGYSLAGSKDSLNTVKLEILAVNRQMEEVFNKSQYSLVAEFYADSAVMVGNQVEIIGRNNLTEYWAKFENAHQWSLENTDIVILGSSAILQRGYSNISYYNNGELKESHSIFSLVWIKTDQGWKILLDHFSPR